ncbi:MAG: hypothetical protein D6808_01080 [Candidatus Dadabacteria bacterium]|nr:MAG: hypothetical protein D6808_01080 [Candidatus Dadabacteria bacterium]
MGNLDRRIIYLLVVVALAYPLLEKWSIKPARMASADKFFTIVESLAPDKSLAFVALDFGPNTKAENSPQAEVVIEHLMRRRIPVILFSQYVLADPFLKSIPLKIKEKLEEEYQGQTWRYGFDWVNLGFRPGGGLIIQSIPKSKSLQEVFKVDANGTPLKELSIFKEDVPIEKISLLAEFTGLVGAFDTYVQFFQKADYRPVFGHGCTSITIPEAYIFLDSGQIKGLLEGIAGAAWYSQRLSQKYPNRGKDDALLINTGLGIAHLLLILLILVGNLGENIGHIKHKGGVG